MKTIFQFTKIVSFLFLMVQCSTVPNWNDEITDLVPPGTVSNIKVDNIPGGAIITYTIPSDKDLLGVKAVYSFTEKGDPLEAYSSSFTDTIKLSGFPNTSERKVKLIAIDKSKNESQPIEVSIQPLTPPIETIRKSLKVNETFSGIFVAWDNVTGADIGISLYALDSLGFWNLDYTYFTKEMKGNYSFRGYEHKERQFRVQIRDRWNNDSSPLDTLLTPLFEQNVVWKDAANQLLWQRYGSADKTAVFRGDFPGVYGTSTLNSMFDGSYSSYLHPGLTTTFDMGVMTGNPAYKANINPYPMGLTIDMMRETKLSRFKIYFRSGSINPNDQKHFAIWATNNKPKGPEDFKNDRIASLVYWTPWVEVNGTDAWKNDWVELGEYNVIPPSGATEQYQWTSEDLAWAQAGVEFDFPSEHSNTPFRYFRVVCYENLKNTVLFHFVEWEIYGSILNNK